MMTATLSEKLAAFIENFPVPANAFQKKMHENLLQLDFPTTRTEYWKYTRVTKIQNSKFQRSNQNVVTKEHVSAIIHGNSYLVIENGTLRNDLSSFDQPGVTVELVKPETVSDSSLLNSLVDQKHIFTALNSTYFES